MSVILAGGKTIPELECDLVMKGGVTSGIVYPSAIAAIAEHYRFRSIGGTSAGAIGAAAAAAMEFGRLSGRNSGAREQLADLAETLGKQDAQGRPLLLRLFEPDRETAGLFRLLMHFADAKTGRSTGAAALRLMMPFILLAALVSVALTVVISLVEGYPSDAAALTWIVVPLLGTPTLASLFALLAWQRRVRDGLRSMAGAGFGFCSGMARHPGEDGADSPPLAEWLHTQFQELANLPLDEPLCFGDLWVASQRVEGMPRDDVLLAAREAAQGTLSEPPHPGLIERDIQLLLVASDISRAQSVHLPFMNGDPELYARCTDLEAQFPPEIVAWMRLHARESALAGVHMNGAKRTEFIRLPYAQHLPVLFGVRMSLSFPFLFRAVRLYVVRRRTSPTGRGVARELAEIWLADGGITSNFPIHLFDAPIPCRPTFCLNLLYHDDELAPEPVGEPEGQNAPLKEAGLPIDPGLDKEPEQLVYMLRNNKSRLSVYTAMNASGPLAGLIGFGSRVVTTARQWGDNQLIDVPGYRDRIVHIRMRPDEGGFNFDMGADRIADLKKRGAAAGSAIAERFMPGRTTDPLYRGQLLYLNWSNHRMTRVRSFLAGLETMSCRFADNWKLDIGGRIPGRGGLDPTIKKVVGLQRGGASSLHVGYKFQNVDQRTLAIKMAAAVEDLAATCRDNPRVGIDFVRGTSGKRGEPGSPRPKSVLRLRPSGEVDPLRDSSNGQL